MQHLCRHGNDETKSFDISVYHTDYEYEEKQHEWQDFQFINMTSKTIRLVDIQFRPIAILSFETAYFT